ncbi:MAG: 16S rRNA (adenine(1518)-N(6)/adenine(1519)-N(6))-dimethyltransferase RsmA [Ignavibacteria bacterium]|nr:16S rRNA (adenine(1518)-N(6)/adenine(1519)-N(6))-dimethyltransferase RsmA [Ignavibacteria bacterium]
MVPDRAGFLRPRKSLGQNFLVDKNTARKIIRAVRPERSDVFVEIGPGQGSLTEHLEGNVRHLVAVEIDPRAVEKLSLRFTTGSVEIICQDFLQFDLKSTARNHGTTVRVLGNIPYNITSPILFHILSSRSSVKDATLMVQREVGQRIVAGPGSKEYGIPSVLSQYYASVSRLFDVPPTVFVPRPEVWSSVIQLTPYARPPFPARDEEFFRLMVRATFGQRRKMLRHSLRSFLGTQPPEVGDQFDLRRRPEDLSVGELVELSNLLYDRRTIVKGL